MNQLTYFKPEEVEGLEPEVATKLDQARHIAQVPFIITSTRRSPEKNTSVGGSKNSAHLRGLAVDLAVPDSETLFHMVSALLQAGFERLVIGVRIDGGKIVYHNLHCDLDSSLPTPVVAVKLYG